MAKIEGSSLHDLVSKIWSTVFTLCLLAAYPQPCMFQHPTQLSVEVGQTITMDCPIAVGALRGLYSFSWRKGLQTLATTGPETLYSVDPMNKSLTIAVLF